MNYRLGPLGFFYSSSTGPDDAPGNMGLMDQAMALNWVRDNVKNFGGDPDRITLFGESAGSASVHYLMMSPMTEKSFHKAILQSGVAGDSWSYNEPKEAEKASLKLAQMIGCDDADHDDHDDHDHDLDISIVQCMRSKDASSIIKAVQAGEMMELFLPTTDSKFFPWTLEEALKMEATKEGEKAKDVMIGLNRDEGTLDLLLSGSTEFGPGVGKDDDLAVKIFDDFVQYALPEAKDPFVMDKIRHQYFYGRVRDIARLFANGFFDCDIAKTADALAKNGDRKVYRYLFDVEYRYVGNAYPYLGASHSLELQALWGRPYVETEIYTDEERKVAGQMMYYWGEFAKGSPDLEAQLSMVPEGHAVVLHKEDGYIFEKYDTEKCHFLDCIPSLAEFSQTNVMPDMDCATYLMSAGEKIRASGLLLITAMAVFLQRFLILN